MADISRSNLFEELKRRGVLRVGLAYLLATWVLIQIADTVFPHVGLPDKAISLVIVLLAIGFVPALILAWMYELTPGGIARDDAVDRSQSKSNRQALRGLDYGLIAILVVVIAAYVYEKVGQPIETDVAGISPSIAVLPFENRSANPDDEYFVDGIHDDILTSLAKIGTLKVISRTSVEQFRDTDKTIAEIGDELGVVSILEGGVQRAGDRIRINIRLIDVATDTHQWVETFDRQLTAANIFSIQTEIATTIATSLRALLSDDEQIRVAQVPTDNLEAYEAYLIGNQRLQRRTGAAIQEAVDFFEEAVGLDPNFALAYVGLADSYQLLGIYANQGREEALPLALSAANRAIALDPDLGEAYASLGAIHNEYRTEEDPEQLFQRGLELSPNYSTAHQWYGEYLESKGQYEMARVHLQRAVELDPLSPIINVQLANNLSRLGEFAEAEERLLKAIKIDPGFSGAYQGLAQLYFNDLGRFADGVMAAEKAAALDPTAVIKAAMLADLYSGIGGDEEADRWLLEAKRLGATNRFTVFAATKVYMSRGEFGLAIEELQNSGQIDERAPIFMFNMRDDYLRDNRIDEARRMYVDLFPELSPANESEVGWNNYGNALGFVRVLQKAGEQEEASILLDRVWQFVNEKNIPNERQELIMNARIYALRGEKASALAELRLAVDAGLLEYWRYGFGYNPDFDSIRDEPEFQAMASEVSAKMAEQLADVRARKTREQ